MELRLCFATVFRKFDIELDKAASPEKLEFQDSFLPFFTGNHVRAKMTAVNA